MSETNSEFRIQNRNFELRTPNSELRRNKVLFAIALFLSFAFVPISNLSAGTDTTPPTDVTDLKAKESGSDVYLWWSSATDTDNKGNPQAVAGYTIWRGTFTGMISCAVPATTFTTSNTFYTDTGTLNDNNNYYYFVKAYDSASPANESVNFSDLGFKICRSVTYRTTISNIIWWSIPYWYRLDLGGGNAQVLANDMNGTLCTGGCSCTKVGRWRDDAQIYQNYVLWFGAWGPAGSNFGLSSGVGYLAINAQTTVWKIVGSHKTATLSWAYNASSINYHWISIPYHALYSSANDLVNTGGSTNNKIPNCTQISRWNETTQTYIDYFNIGSWTGTNFSLVPGEAYMIVINANSSWIPSVCVPGITSTPTSTFTLTPAPAFILNRAYVPNFSSDNSVSVIDTVSNIVIATVVVGLNPCDAAITPNGSLVYVGNWGLTWSSGNDNVSVIRTSDNIVVTTIVVGEEPIGIAITPNSSFVYVANRDILGTNYSVSVIDTSFNTVVKTIIGGQGSRDVTITPNGSFAYVINDVSPSFSVSAIDTASKTVIATIGVGAYPAEGGITPDGSFVYVTNYSSNNVSVIRINTNTVITTIGVGTQPCGIAITPSGFFAYVADYSSNNSVSIINISSNTVVTTVVIGVPSNGDAITPDGSYVYLTNPIGNRVSVIETNTNTIVATVMVGMNPNYIAIK